MDKIPWDSQAKLVIIDDLSITSKSISSFSNPFKPLQTPPPHSAMLKVRKKMRVHVFNIAGGMGERLGHVKVEYLAGSLFCVFIKRHKCTFVPRLFVHDCSS